MALWQERYKRETKNRTRDEERDESPLHRLEEINPDSIQWLKEYGIDLHAGDRIEIAPSVQHFQGGVKIGKKANSSLKGLYAAGECAGGQHGANRPGGNALLDGQVFGKIAGREAALEATSIRIRKEVSPSQIKLYLAQLRRMALGKEAAEVRREVHSVASQFASVVRTEEGLKEGLKTLARLKKEGISPDGKGLIFALETKNLLDAAEIILRACLLRKESRGPHLFFNHLEDSSPLPSQDTMWRKYIVIQKRNGKMVLKKKTPTGMKG
jgi:succinate dehydrogenase / fumarate reductase flavoprotein subunit